MLLSSYLFNNCCLLDGGGENDLIRDFWDVKIKYCHYTQQQNRSLLLVTGKMLNVLLEIMCFISIKHETQESFSHFLEHTWMTDTSLFPPQNRCRAATLYTDYSAKLFKPQGWKFSQLQKKKWGWEGQLTCSYLFEVLLQSAEDTPHLPCLHKPPVQVQSSTKSVNWYPLPGPYNLPS